jgi:hypothetical protein
MRQHANPKPTHFLRVLTLSVVLASCNQYPAPSPPAPQPLPATTFPSALPSTATSPPAPTAAATTTPLPEKVATSPGDIAGAWLLHVNGVGGMVKFDTTFLIKLDGTYTIDDITGGMHIEAGTYSFAGETLVLDSDECYRYTPTVEFFHCVGTYTVFSTIQGTVPVRLRFVRIDDSEGGDRALNLKNRVLLPVTP